MSDETIRRMIEDTYDDSKEDTVLSIVRDFYSRKMRSIALLVWGFAVVLFAGAVYGGIQFLNTDQTKDQIMYASIFVLCVEGIALMKIFAWQMLARNSIKREIKRLELRIVDLTQTIKTNG